MGVKVYRSHVHNVRGKDELPNVKQPHALSAEVLARKLSEKLALHVTEGFIDGIIFETSYVKIIYLIKVTLINNSYRRKIHIIFFR